MEPPKLFISYSWSSAEHDQWVLDLATDLRNSRVDVILDKWELKEGHDAIVFMEKMVNDPAIKKVAMICDEVYSRKADNRAGGVGTETQIISKEVYDSQGQDKFVAVVKEKDADGKPFLPTYYKSRIYIDLSDAGRAAENFEKLLRWVFDKPIYVKPDLGSAPSFLSEGDGISLGTSALFTRSLDAIKNAKGYALGAFDEYCTAFSSNFNRFWLEDTSGDFDEKVVASLSEFTPYRNEFLRLVTAIAQYDPRSDYLQRIHRLFEHLMPFMLSPPKDVQYGSLALDNYKFIVHELFLHVVGTFLRYERFDELGSFLVRQYYLKHLTNERNAMLVDFTAINNPTHILTHRNQRIGARRLSLRADMIRDRCAGSGLEFRSLMETDFILFLRAELISSSTNDGWRPETLVHVGRFHSAFEIFAKCSSISYFERFRPVLGIRAVESLGVLLADYKSGKRHLPSWEHEGFAPQVLMGFDRLVSLP